jgi:hypothetical protein
MDSGGSGPRTPGKPPKADPVEIGASNRQRFAEQRPRQHLRDELLGVLPGTVVVGTVRDNGGKSIRVVPGTNQVVAMSGFAGWKRRSVFSKSVPKQ